MGLFEKNENNGICYLKKIIYEKLTLIPQLVTIQR